MNKLVFYPLIMLVFVAGFFQLYTFSNLDLSHNDSRIIDSYGSTITENGTSSSVETESVTAVFNINMVSGVIALIIGLVAIGVVAGIRVLGSGLSEHSVKLIYNSSVYYGMWGIFSALAFPVFTEIPLMGLFFWLGLTLVYTLGFFETTHNG